MNGLIIKVRILAVCLGASFALLAQAQHSVEWIKEMPPSAPAAGQIMVPAMETPQARPVNPGSRSSIS